MLSDTEYDKALLKVHMLHVGVYRRVAEKLGVDPSYVSRVATGKRKAPEIHSAILDELRKRQRHLRCD
jgi:DNA-binding transcriptional regulator YdaS (Cro superfamily)